MNKQSLVGLKFGKLTVLSQDISNSKGSLAWVCKCDCGNQTIVINNKLKNGYTQSCGCLHKEKFHNKKINPTDLVGIKCGYFTISKYLGQINLGFKSGQQRYEHEYYCVCKCGKEKIIRRNSLLNKKIASCGCIQKDNYYEKLLKNIVKKFGRLLVINVIKDECKLLCKCECGKEIKTKINPLKNNKKSSCGCLLKESQISNAKKATKSNTLNGIDYILNYNYSIYNHSAKKRNISFELSHEFFNKIIMKNCYYCNSIPSREISLLIQN